MATSQTTAGAPDEPVARSVPVADIVRYYLRLGLLGFGGPVALCAQMERDLVHERRWVTPEEMREAIAVCQSLPGPLAIQLGILLSYLRAGVSGACAGGVAFILPNFVIVALVGALYRHYGDLPVVTAVFYGVSPAVVALIVHSCRRLAQLGMEDAVQWLVAAACFVVTIAARAEVGLLLVAAGVLGVFWYGDGFRRASVSLPLVAAVRAAPAAAPSGAVLLRLFAFFLKAGALTFGSGLVIVPFLEKGLVEQAGWIDERQFVIAVAIGMVSPGPVVITATFVGFLVAGVAGSIVATIGIFSPSFVLVLTIAPLLVRHRADAKVRGFVKGAYGAAIGTILATTVLLARIAIGDALTLLIAIAGLVALFRWTVAPPVLVAVAALVGIVAYPLLQPQWILLR